MTWAAALRRRLGLAVEDRTPNESIDVAGQLAQLLAKDPPPPPRRTHAGKSSHVFNQPIESEDE